jgi:hypothetical protein
MFSNIFILGTSPAHFSEEFSNSLLDTLKYYGPSTEFNVIMKLFYMKEHAIILKIP